LSGRAARATQGTATTLHQEMAPPDCAAPGSKPARRACARPLHFKQAVCEQLKVQSQNDTAKLAEAKQLVYLKVGPGTGWIERFERAVAS
jgi:hypothetical protein